MVAFLLVTAGLPAAGEAQMPADTASAGVLRGWSYTFLIETSRDDWSAPVAKVLQHEGYDRAHCTLPGWFSSGGCTLYPIVQRPGILWTMQVRREITRRFDAGLSASWRPLVQVKGRGRPDVWASEIPESAYESLILERHVGTIAPIASLRLEPLFLHGGPALHRIRSTVQAGGDVSSDVLDRVGYVLGGGFVITTKRVLTFEARAQYRGIPGEVTFPTHTRELGMDWDPATESFARHESYTLPNEPVRLSHWVLGFGAGVQLGGTR